MSLSENEKLYMPSQWSKRFKAEQLLENYSKFCEETTNKVRNTIEHKLNIAYGHSKNAKYDVYGINLPKESPILLFIHGGYWQEFSKDLSCFMVPSFVSNGIKVIIGGYDLCPNVKLTDIVQQIKDLVENVLELAYESDSKCVWISGHSAGAHLAASLLHDQTWFNKISRHRHLLKGIVLIAGIYALEPLLRTSVNDSLKLNMEEIKLFTFAPFEENIDIDYVQNAFGTKVLVTVGECDSPIFLEESRRYVRRLSKFIDNVEFLLIRNEIDHFNIVENLTDPDFVLTKRLVEYILNKN